MDAQRIGRDQSRCSNEVRRAIVSGNRCCPSCGADIGKANLCLACGFTGCEDDDHTWESAGDPSVGIPWHSECRECGMTDDEDLSADDYDFYDDYSRSGEPDGR